MVDPDQLRHVGHPRPQLERPLAEVGGFAVGQHALGRHRGADGAAQCRGLVARGGVVTGYGRSTLQLALVAPLTDLF